LTTPGQPPGEARLELIEIAQLTRDWAKLLPFQRVYIFGSFVRGDNRPDSDLDIAIEFATTFDSGSVANWKRQNQTDFKDLKRALGVRVSLHCDADDLAWPAIHSGAQSPVYSTGNVLCVLTPRVK
jgi:predicted nucleotidyltransferase